MIKNLPTKAEDAGSIPESGISPGEGNGNPLQYSCLENSMHREAWWATVHRVTKELDTTEGLNNNNGQLQARMLCYANKRCSAEVMGSQKMLCQDLATRDYKCWPHLRESFLGGALTGEPLGHCDSVYNSGSAHFYRVLIMCLVDFQVLHLHDVT